MTHLYFAETPNEGKKTRTYVVYGYKDSYLGDIRWHGAWRQYCFFPLDDCVWSHDCLTELGIFIKQLMEERREAI